jgi:hypothetical protein
MANCSEHVRLTMGSHDHAASIGKQLLTRQVGGRPLRQVLCDRFVDRGKWRARAGFTADRRGFIRSLAKSFEFLVRRRS